VGGGSTPNSGAVTLINADTDADTYTVVGTDLFARQVTDIGASPNDRIYVSYSGNDPSQHANSLHAAFTTAGGPNTMPSGLGGFFTTANDGRVHGAVAVKTVDSADKVYLTFGPGLLYYNMENDEFGDYGYLSLGSEAKDVAVTGDRVYVTLANGSVAVIDTNTDTRIDTNPNQTGTNNIGLPTGVKPTSVSTNPDGTQAYVAGDDGKIYVVKVEPPSTVV
jgi:hypothetical protein